MNKRARELLSQAGFDPAAIERMGVMPQAEKFFELIVRECCNVLYDNELGGYQVNYVLKEHFGVK